MTTLQFGIKPGVGPAMKIMKNDTDDPWTTPNNQYGKFILNSENSLISYILGIIPFNYGGPSVYPPATAAGGTVPNAYWVTPYHLVTARTINNPPTYFELHYFDAKGYFNLDYEPLKEVRVRTDPGSNEFNGQIWEFITTRGGGPGVPSSGDGSMSNAYDANFTQTIYPPNMGGNELITPPLVAQMNSNTAASRRERVLSVWEPPSGNVTYSLPSGTPVVGQTVIDITPTRAAMARPGFDTGSATGRQFIFNSDRIPAKILAAGEFTLAAGGTEIVSLSAFQPLSQYVYVDALSRRLNDPLIGNRLLHPPLPYFVGSNVPEDVPVFTYDVQTSRVVFRSTRSFDVVVRYLICADDEQGQSSGGNTDVLRVDVDLGYVQICKPGAANPPRFRDIMVDSRMAYLPIIAQGYIPASAFTNVNTESGAATARGTHYANAITFANDGSFKPFLKYSKVNENTGIGYNPKATRFWNSPDQDGWHNKYSSSSIIADITDTSVTFFGNPNNPEEARWRPDGSGGSEFYTTPAIPTGVRYYILAIPT